MEGDDKAEFVSQHQGMGVVAVLERSANLLFVDRTGGGKTLLAILAAHLFPHLKLVMVVPFRSLEDIQGRIWRRGIKNLEVVHGESITPELVETWRKEASRGKIHSVVVDEIHSFLIDRSYRPILGRILRANLPVPFVFLSATFPPSLERELGEKFPPLEILRTPTTRPNLSIRVTSVVGNSQHLKREELKRQVLSFLGDKANEGRQILIICLTVDEVGAVHRILGEEVAKKYFSEMEEMEKKEAAQKYIEGKAPVIVATSGFGTGLISLSHFYPPRSPLPPPPPPCPLSFLSEKYFLIFSWFAWKKKKNQRKNHIRN